jgi:hypothetical protein
MKRWLGLLVCLFLGAVAMIPPSSAADAPAVVVGRVYAIEGDLLRYVPDENDWVAVVRDAPFGPEDTLFSGSRGMAELVAPNGTWIRVGNSTQIQFIALGTGLSEMDVAAGMARFYNKGSNTVIKATSPFGYVLAYPGAVFDFYVGENSVEVVAVKGTVSFVHTTTDTRYDVSAGSPSILADQNQVSSGEGTVDPDWDRWNTTRETFWAAKARVRGRSVEYLPPGLQSEAYALEENGRWESVPYEGSSRWFWRPTTVRAGWSPFTAGRWTEWYGDQCWIPAEPFGYVTHHYGNWVYTRNAWYWAPPVASVRVGLPLLNVGFFWYPGRVSWIHSGTYVGWVPLAPRETYYSHRHWGGPHEVVVTNVTQININVRNYAYANQAIVINQNNFYRVNNYRDARVTNINSTTIINNYRAAPVVNNTVINNYTTNKERFNYTNVTVNEKPHNTVINRIQHNETIIRGARKEDAAMVQERAKDMKEGRPNREARIEPPRSTNYIVPAGDANRPKSEIKLQQREIKGGGRGAPQVQPGAAVKPEPQPGQSGARPERVAPARPGQQPQPVRPAQPAARPEPVPPPPQPAAPPPAAPERVSPARPVPPQQPAAQQPRPGQPEQARPERVAPTKPVPPPPQPPAAPERVTPAKPVPPPPQPAPAQPQPAQPEQARPDRVTPAKPVPPPPQPAPPERVAPAKPAPPPAPPERVAPTKPVPPPQPPAPPERVAPAKSGHEEQPKPEPGQQEKPR